MGNQWCTFLHIKDSEDRVAKETPRKSQLTMNSLLSLLEKQATILGDVYNLLRTPAKVVVAVLSDLDRQFDQTNVHGIPVAYGLSGYSLKLECMRSMMTDVIHALVKLCQQMANSIDLQ